MATTLKTKNSVTAASAPSSLAQGELAVNITDKKLWVGNAATTPVQLIGTGADGNFTNLTVVNDATINGIKVGKGGGSIATNTILGVSALATNSAGSLCTAIGYQAGTAGNIGSCTYIGAYAGKSTITNGSVTFVGSNAGYTNTTGYYLTSLGCDSLYSNTTGISSVAIGHQALYSNTTASNNTAVGYQAGYSNTTGTRFTAVGYQAGLSNTTTSNSAFFGSYAGLYSTGLGNTGLGDGAIAGANGSTNGTYNSAVGQNALSALTTGNFNCALGASSLGVNTTGAGNVGIGYQALVSNTTASNNTAVGYQAGYSNTTGSEVTAVGYRALYSNTTGLSNTAIGQSALASNTTGPYNVALGNSALATNTTGTGSVALGYVAGTANTGNYNTYLGFAAGQAATSGTLNTFVGSGSGYVITTGSKNVILGSYGGNQGGLDIRTASNYIVLSDGDGNPRIISDNNGRVQIGTASIAYTAQLTVKNTASYTISSLRTGTGSEGHLVFENGNGAVGTIFTNGSTTLYNTTSDYRLKTVISPVSDAGQRIDALKPVEYDWKAGGRTRGFLAHQFAEVYPNSVSGEKDAVDAEGNPVYQAMQASTPEVIADLIAEIQSLRKRISQLEGK